jgi:hypothetical protein
MKKSKIFLSVFLILLFSNFIIYQDLEKFSFDKLKSKKIAFKDISIDNGQEIYDERISGIKEAESNSKRESKIYKIKISQKYPIYHGCYDSIPNNKHENNGEYLQFYDTKININSLLKNNSNKKIYSGENYILFTGGIDFFKFKGNDFILLSARDRRFFRNLERNYWILLNVENKNILQSFCFIDGYTLGNNCFGDFNSDGLLDYLNWDFRNDKISIYSLSDNKFKVDKNHFIKVKQSKEQEKITQEQDIIFIYDLLDKKNSKWFYKL